MAHHLTYAKHTLETKATKILDQSSDWRKRGIKEAIYIRAHGPELNKDEGRHKMPETWDNVVSSLLHRRPRWTGGSRGSSEVSLLPSFCTKITLD